MDDIINDIKKIIESMGFRDFSVNQDEKGSRISVFFNEGEIPPNFLPVLISSFDHLIKLVIKKKDGDKPVFVDINNYRKERENIILEIARGAARKALAQKEDVSLPFMNSYERRLIHSELAHRPDIKTESMGEGKNRYVIVKPIL